MLNFRLVYDRETGRPKGFGFAEYQDADSAASAVRNLNDYEIMNRKLRVDFSHEGGDDEATAAGAAAAPLGYTPQAAHLPAAANGTAAMVPSSSSSSSLGAAAFQQQHQAQQNTSGGGGGASILPPLPPGVDVPPGLTCPEAISRTLATLPPSQLLEILTQMKGMAMTDPLKAVELFRQSPQLSYAIFQALLLMGLVDASALQSVIEQTAATMTSALGGGGGGGGGGVVVPVLAAAAHQQPPPPPPLTGPTTTTATSTSTSTLTTPAAPAVIPSSSSAPVPAPATLDKAALLQYVATLTPDQLNAMPPAEREQIAALRQQILAGTLRL